MMKNSPMHKIVHHPKPVDGTAARVGFFRGEHFDVEFTEDRPKRRLTMDMPPRCAALPALAFDFSGWRRGRMIAFRFFRLHRNGKSAIWVARCDCGRFEFRRPYKWLKHPNDLDMCEVCEREREVLSGYRFGSGERHQQRLLVWVAHQRRLGLTDAEIAAVRRLDLTVRGKSLEQIREEIKLREEVA